MYASLLKMAPGGLKRGARLASGAFYRAVCLLTFYEIIKDATENVLFTP
jgi:hypothetical protein